MLKYTRFAIPAIALALTCAFILPQIGVLTGTGFMGFLGCFLSGVVFTGVFRLARLIEARVIERQARTKVAAEAISVLAVIPATVLVCAGLLQLTAHFLPSFLQMQNFGYALAGGFFLSTFGFAFTPSASIAYFLRQPEPEVDATTEQTSEEPSPPANTTPEAAASDDGSSRPQS